jgi:3-oxoacyl-[acyl-carrier-protein] synthase III
MKKSRILGTGQYVPPKRLTNDDIKKHGLDTLR